MAKIVLFCLRRICAVCHDVIIFCAFHGFCRITNDNRCNCFRLLVEVVQSPGKPPCLRQFFRNIVTYCIIGRTVSDEWSSSGDSKNEDDAIEKKSPKEKDGKDKEKDEGSTKGISFHCTSTHPALPLKIRREGVSEE